MRFDKSKVDPSRLQDPSRLEGLGCCDGHHCQGGGGEVEDLPYCVPADGLRCKGCAWDEGKQVEVCCAVAERGHLAAQAGGGGRGSAPNSGLQQQQAFSHSSCPCCRCSGLLQERL